MREAGQGFLDPEFDWSEGIKIDCNVTLHM